MDKKFINGILIADMHWGATQNLQRYMDELELSMFHTISKLSQLDFIIILGDTFHTKEYLNSEVVSYVLEFFYRLKIITQRLNTEIRIIEGTLSHDNLQLSPIEYIFKDDDRLIIYNKISVETLFGMDILYIPEEYVLNQKEYYNKYFNYYYDYIFGHGMVDAMQYSKTDKDGFKQHLTSSPIFKVDDLLSISQQCYFGHIHTRSLFGDNDRFKYVGSPSRWSFGQEEDKGFYYIIYDTIARKQCYEKFIINNNAPIMNTVTVDINNNINNNTFNEYINIIIKENLDNCDKLWLKINIDEELKDFTLLRDFALNLNKVYTNIRIDVIKQNKKNKRKDSDNINLTNNSYILSSMSDAEKISKRIYQTENKIIEPETIKKFII